MIQKIKTYQCRVEHCRSTNIIKNGYNNRGSLQYHCKDCGARKVLNPKLKYTQERIEEILKVYYERGSMRGVCRIFGVSRITLASWLKKSLKSSLKGTLLTPCKDDILEVDEMWS